MWLRDAVARGQAPDHRADDARPVRVLPLPVRPRALVATSASAGATRRSAPSSRPRCRAASSRRSAARSGSPWSSSRDQWRDAVQKQYLPEIGARAKARAVADELLTEKRSDGHAAPGAGPLARRLAGRVLQREGLLLRRPVPGRRRHRAGQAPAPQVRRQQQLRDLPVHQLAGQLVARRQVPGLRRQAGAAGRHRHRGRRRATSRCSAIQLKLERRHHAVLEPRRQAARLHRLRRRRSATSSSSTRDGSDLQRLTDDKYADLHPVWSPDGKTIAFATDRGPGTDFKTLGFGNFRIALYDLATGERPGARPHGPGQERQPAVGARRQVARLRVRPERRERHLPVRPGPRRGLPADRLLHRRPGHHAAVAGALLGAATPTGWPSCTTRTRSTTSTP